MGKCNLSVREQEGEAVGGVADGVRWESVIYPSVNRRKEQLGVWQKVLL